MSSLSPIPPDVTADTVARGTVGEVAHVFGRLGCTAFGGPAAHIAMMRNEVVTRRRWLSDARFADLLGAVNLIPGPNSTELGIYLGYLRAGWWGLLVAGVCFIGPAMVIVLALAWAYVTFGSLPAFTSIFVGIKPVVLAIIIQATVGLARTILRGPAPIALALSVLLGYLLGVNTLLLLVIAGFVALLVHYWRKRQAPTLMSFFAGFPALAAQRPLAATTLVAGSSLGLATLFLTFLKIGAVLYGSGYVLLAFLRADFVVRLHWLTDRQLLDAVSIGQFTPGPVFTTATFIGYLVGSWPGALLATLAIFLPAFVFVPLIHPLAERMRHSPATAALLGGVNAGALALLAGVALQLGQTSILNLLSVVIAATSLVILLRTKLNSAWLILAGGLIGFLLYR